MTLKPYTLFLLTFFLLPILVGCGAENKAQAVAPFSHADWQSTPEQIAALHEENAKTTVSLYGGSSYLFPVTWLEHEGTVKYMYNEKNQLMSIAFYYEADSAESLTALYDRIRSMASQSYGKSITTTNQDNLGERWIRSEGNIILAAFWNEESCALQYSFLHPEVSRDAEGNLVSLADL